MNSVVIKFGGYQKPASIHNLAAVRFGEILKHELGDRISFELIGDVLALGRGSGDLLPMVERGELDCCYISTVRFTGWIPEFKLLELPFVIKSRPAAIAALNGGLGEYFSRRVREATPYRVLGFWDNGFRHFSNRVRPIRAPADCRGLRIRTQMSELHGEVFRTLGFAPVPADIKEFVAEIAGDRFQAQDNPLTNIYNFDVHKFHRYHTLTGHSYLSRGIYCNRAAFESWPAALQTAMLQATRAAVLAQRELAVLEEEVARQAIMDAGGEIVELTPHERAAFVQAVKPLHDEGRGRFGDAFALLEAARAKVE